MKKTVLPLLILIALNGCSGEDESESSTGVGGTTPEPTVTPIPTVTPVSVVNPTPTVTPDPTEPPINVVVPAPGVTPDPIATPSPIVTPAPIVNPDPTLTPAPTATPAPGALVGDAELGKTLYDTTHSCSTCHGETGTAPIFIFPDIDPTKTSIEHSEDPGTLLSLENYIQTWMPSTNIGSCDEQCAADIASYIRTWNTDDGVVAIDCGIEGITYGRRQMRLLTTLEYENTLYDLVGYDVDAGLSGIPSDTEVEGFSNQILTSVTQEYADAYSSVAEAAAAFAAENNFAGVAACDDLSNAECAETFIADFAPKAFRRALTTEEADRYRALFDASLSEGSNSEALQLALRTIFTSPYFLYRSEMGVQVADIIDQIENGDPVFEAGTVGLILNADSLGAEGADYRTVTLYNNFGTTVSDYTFTGNDLIVVRARGTLSDGAYPSIALRVDNTEIDVQALTSDSEGNYSFTVTGVTGNNKYVQITNDINGQAHSQGRNLDIASISFSDSVLVEQELPDADLDLDAYVLTQYEIATFLAYTYTGSTPDDTLLAAAKANALSTDAEIQTQISRLLSTDRSRSHFGEFAAQWLQTDDVLSTTKSTTLFPSFTQDVRESMSTEVRKIFEHVMFDETQSVTDIYTNFSFMNQTLADYYGVSGPTGDDFVKVEGLSDRGGVLTSGAFMAGFAHEEESSPIIRSVRYREQMLCQEVPPMPTNIDSERSEADEAFAEFLEANGGAVTNRERYAFLTQSDTCAVCHDEIINPHGFGMEDFDAAGLPRITDANDFVIDASGALIGTYSLNDTDSISFHGAKELSIATADLPAAQECFTQKGFRFVMGIGEDVFDSDSDSSPELANDEIDAYSCAIESMNSTMSASNNNARSAFTALGVSDIIRYRKQR